MVTHTPVASGKQVCSCRCVCVCVCVCVQHIIHLHYYWVYTKCLRGIMSERFAFEHEGFCPPDSLTYIRLSAISPPFSPPLPFPPLPSPPLYLPPISSPLLPSPPLSSTLLSPSQVLELLIHRCAHSAHPEFHCIGDIFKRIMECIASGALLSGMPSLVLSTLCAYVRT